MTDSTSSTPYRVLARKYRPTDFATLIGQEAMVRTLSNAIATGRLAHAFVLTGVRGVGKTTTARIIARALNCIGLDGHGGPTITPCGTCSHCRAIAEDRHVDILEMDAASHTGVNDIREILEGVRYRPTSARFKIYIIDEVHMLSTAAFNALLKTLEEPPDHVKFIFATTEIRKIPVTVLSRCQRFDLRRVEIEVLSRHFSKIAALESAAIEEGALGLIARAADGSVRDGLSLLDQAISHGAGTVSEELVRTMLGLADRTQVFDLFEQTMRGHIAPALEMLGQQYALGADPVVVLQDMLEVCHWLTRLKVAPQSADSTAVPEAERVRGKAMAEGLSMAHLTRAWQMLLKGLQETRQAPRPLQAAEMALVRLGYVADLPTPLETIRQVRSQPSNGGGGGGGGSVQPPRAPLAPPPSSVGGGISEGATALKMAPMAVPAALPLMPTTFQAMVALFSEKRENVLAVELRRQVQLVRFEPGRLEFRPLGTAPQDLSQRVRRLLESWTGRRWTVAVNLQDPAESTLADQERAEENRRREDAAAHPLVLAIQAAFPGATIEAVHDIAPPADAGEDDLGFDTDVSGEDDL